MPKEPKVVLYTSPYSVMIEGLGDKPPISISPLELGIIRKVTDMSVGRLANEFGITKEEAFRLLFADDMETLVGFARAGGLATSL